MTETLDQERPAHDMAKSQRRKSSYPPGSSFRPPKKRLARCQEKVLEVLKKAGPGGVTRLEVPDHLNLSFPQRISELRSKGFRIDSKRERVGDANMARYVLVSTDRGRGVMRAKGAAWR